MTLAVFVAIVLASTAIEVEAILGLTEVSPAIHVSGICEVRSVTKTQCKRWGHQSFRKKVSPLYKKEHKDLGFGAQQECLALSKKDP